MRLCLKNIAVLLFLCSLTTMVRAEDDKAEVKPVRYKTAAWNFGLGLERLRYETETEQPLDGNRGVFSFGYGQFLGHFYYGLNIDLILGPYQEVRKEHIKTDFYGTGFHSKVSYAFAGDGFRSRGGTWSIDLGLSYSDIVGRSVAKSRDQGDGRIISDMSVRISQFSGLGMISYSWLVPARPAGNLPELLMTRIEGYSVSAGATLPIKATYMMRYLEEKPSNQVRTERGDLTGYSILCTFAVFLGV